MVFDINRYKIGTILHIHWTETLEKKLICIVSNGLGEIKTVVEETFSQAQIFHGSYNSSQCHLR